MKKLYNNILMQLVLALYAFSFTACQQFDIDSQPEGPLNIQIDALDTYTVLATSPSNVVFNISSNTPWSVTSDRQWCKPSPAMSAASSLVSEIVVIIEDNPDKESRTATLTIKAENIEKEKVITITQASKEELVVIPYGEIVSANGEAITFDIISNKPWQVIPSSSLVSNIDKQSGEGNENGEKESITVTIPVNSGIKRTADITVKTAFEEKTFTITQDGISIEPANPEETSNELGGEIGEKTITINANVEWNVKVPDEFKEWLAAEANDNQLTLKTIANSNAIVPRTGHVLLSPKQTIAGFEDVVIEVVQQSLFTITGSYNIIDATTGYTKVMKCDVVSSFLTQKGHVTFEFDDMNMTGSSYITFYMKPLKDKGDANFYFKLCPDNKTSTFQCGGGFAWAAKTLTLSTEEVNAIRKIEFYIEDDPNNAGKLRLRLLINEVEKIVLEKRNNIYETDPDMNPGLTINLNSPQLGADDYYIIKSVTYEPEK